MKSTVKFVSAMIFLMTMIMATGDVLVSLACTAKSGFDDTIVETDSCRIIKSDLYTTWAVCDNDTVAINNRNQVVDPLFYCLKHSTSHTHFHVKRAKARIVHGKTTLVPGTVESYQWSELTVLDTYYAGDVIITMLLLVALFIYYTFGTWSWSFNDEKKWTREDIVHCVTTMLLVMADILIMLFYNCGVRAEALCL